MHQRGAVADAASRYLQVLKFEPKNVDALCLLGRAYRELKRLPDSVELLRQATKLAPRYAVAHNYLGQTLTDQNRPEEALKSFHRAISIQPDLMEAYVNRADLLMALNRLVEAVETYDRALAARPNFVEGYCNRGIVLEAMGRLDDAIKSYDRAIALRPNFTAAHANRGNALAKLGNHEAAVGSFDRALALAPDFVEVHMNRGNALTRLGRREEAITSYDKALAIRPEMAEAQFARGMILREQSRFGEAVECFDRAIALNRDDALGGLFHLHRAETLHELGRFAEGLTDALRCLEVASENDQVAYGVSMIELLHGRWLEAWPRYERRLALGVSTPSGLLPPWPRWGGEALGEELLVLCGEQGIGDHIQFAMLGSHLAERGYRIALWTNPIMESLLRTTIGVERVICDPATLDGQGPICCTSMMSVPGHLALTPETIPRISPYFSISAKSVRAWKERLNGGSGLKVGLVWAGNQQNVKGRKRSISIEQLAPLFAVRGVSWFSLQVGEQAADIERAPVESITDLSPLLTDFYETAGAISALDMVLSIDTAVAHLAGALAKPVWIMLPFLADWRWLLDREDSPWYPTARLFRQPGSGDWPSVVARVAEALRASADSETSRYLNI